MMGLHRGDRMSARSKMGAKWLSKIKKTQVGHKDSLALSVVHLSPFGSQLSFSNAPKIDTVVDWDAVRRKYRGLVGAESQKPIDDTKEPTEDILSAFNEPNTSITGVNERFSPLPAS